MKPSVLLFAKRNKPEAQEASRQLADWLRAKSFAVVDVTASDDRLSPEAMKNVILGVAIGGDGTFLTLVRRLEQKNQFPIMGVNLGTLGFITEIDRGDMLTAMQDVLDKKYTEELRRLLQVELVRGDKTVHSGIVFNDAAITKDARTSMLKMDVEVGDEFLSEMRADGYIVSTPTGSTAYSLSAGGPLVHPEVSGIVLVPICSHSLSSRPIVVPPRMTIQIRMGAFTDGEVYLVYDGQISCAVHAGDTIRIFPGKNSLRLIRSPKQRWGQTVRQKLKMG